MKIDILTIFPEFFEPFFHSSKIKHAIQDGQADISCHQLRDYAIRKPGNIDDNPYGGGVGILLQFPPFYQAIKTLKKDDTKIYLLSPQGQLFDQKMAQSLSHEAHIVLLCGHYEGVDARVLDIIDGEISIGDYVLTGGEIPAMIVTDAVVRLLPDVIHEQSSAEDSLSNGWLKYPQYTKPEVYKGYRVPDILLSGHHANIEAWRKEQSIKATWSKRKDLIKQINMTDDEKKILETVKQQSKS